MNNYVFPPRALPGKSDNWGRAVEQRDAVKSKEITQVSQDLNNGLRAIGGQLAVIGTQVETLASQQEALQQQQLSLQSTLDRLSNAGQLAEDASGSDFNGEGWYTNRPAVTMSSLSGRFEVSVIGTSAGSGTYFGFSAPGYPRSRLLGSTAAARTSRVAGAGGASTEMSVYGSWIVTPTGGAGSPITFTGEAYGISQFSSTTALKIQVRPAL